MKGDGRPTSFAHGWLVVDVLKAPEGPVEMGSEMASTRKITKLRGL